MQMEAFALEADRRFADDLLQRLSQQKTIRGETVDETALVADIGHGLAMMDEFGLTTQNQIARCFEIVYGVGFRFRDCPKAALGILLAYRVSPSFKLKRLATWADTVDRELPPVVR